MNTTDRLPRVYKAIFCLLVLTAPAFAAKDIEIYAGGKRYASWEDYQGLKLTLKDTQDTGAKQVESLSIDSGVGHLKVNFEQTWDHPDPSLVISPAELEDKIYAAVGAHEEPLILMADPKRLRLMALIDDK